MTPTNPSPPSKLAPSLDGRHFVMDSSTNSIVDPSSPSTFDYFERDGVVWGDYAGDTVTFGRMVGTRVGNDVQITFVHVTVDDGTVVQGTGSSIVETQPDGSLRLVESFRLHDIDHVSICVEV